VSAVTGGANEERGAVRVGVVGVEHLHLFELVDALVRAGAETVAHAAGEGPLPDMYRGWRDGSEERDLAGVVEDDSIDLVVTAAVPSERAAVAVAALRAGRHVLADKPGVTTAEQLDDVEAAAASSGRRWWVCFTERFENRAVTEAVRLARTGALGHVVSVTGLGPHTAAVDSRPPWFLTREGTGGILVDLGSHQVDQFLAATDADPSGVRVVAAAAGNLAHPDHPGFEDIGHLVLAGGHAVGHHRVDYLTPAGLGTWGDVRLTLVGTEATAEVRANVDPAGAEGADHLIVVDGAGTRRVDCSEVALDWAERLCADVADDGERFQPRGWSEAVTRITLDAATAAEPWGSPR
jgi:predicted dehydrogenase